MIRATDAWLKMGNDQTKVQTGHGPLADKEGHRRLQWRW